MNAIVWTDKLLNKYANTLQLIEKEVDIPTLIAPNNVVNDLLHFLNSELGFNFLTDITAIHYPDKKNQEFCIVYHLHNLVENIRLRLKIYLADGEHIVSATNIFKSANWQEREIFDFFGIIFDNHPNLKRIMNVEEMDYFPLRKEYPLEEQNRKDKDDEMFGR